MSSSAPPPLAPTRRPSRLYRMVLGLMGAAMLVELVVLVRSGQWMNAFLDVAIMLVVFAPTRLRSRLPVRVPLAMQLFATGFLFASLFLGELRGYYRRFWWWDIALHTTSGLLLGTLGFLLVYGLNQDRRIGIRLKPIFVAFFAFCFAVTVGVLWEVFEFAMDTAFGLTMQKPMLGDPSGLTDTMWDLIVDALGALVITAVGGAYLTRGNPSFIEAWIDEFVEQNPDMFDD